MLSLDTPVLAQCGCGGAGMVFGVKKVLMYGKEWQRSGEQFQLAGFRRNIP